MTEEELTFMRIGEVQAEYSYVDRNGDLVHVQEWTTKKRMSNKTYGLKGIKERILKVSGKTSGIFLTKPASSIWTEALLLTSIRASSRRATPNAAERG